MTASDEQMPPPSEPNGWAPKVTVKQPTYVMLRDRLGFWRFTARTAVIAAVAVPAFVVAAVLSVLVLFAAIGAIFQGPVSTDRFAGTESVGGVTGARDWVLSVPVEGVITSYGSAGLAGGTGGQEIRDLLEEAAVDPRIKAVVVEFSTPGGTIPGSMDIAAGVVAVQEAGKPVVAFVRDLSASGGVWAMAPADVVVAHPGSMVGSVGVLFGPLRYYDQPLAVDDGVFGGGVTTAGGVDEFYITAGTGKDLGNPYREVTDAERSQLQAQVDAQYERFVDHLVTTRGLDADAVRDDIGASIMTADAAVAAGLVDWTGSRAAAWEAAAEAAGLGDFDVRTLPIDRGLLSGLLGVETGTSAPVAGTGDSVLCGRPQAFALFGDPAVLCR